MATTSSSIARRLNNYRGLNIWQDVIYRLPGYDEAATEALDPDCRSDRFALTDGRTFRYVDDGLRFWVEDTTN